MRRWTVILIPHDRGARRSFNLHGWHLWGGLGSIALVSIFGAIFYFQGQKYRSEMQFVSDQYRELEKTIEVTGLPASMEERLAERESQIRAEYEARDRAMAEELSKLYDLEREVRNVTGLPANEVAAGVAGSAPVATDGKGGPPEPGAGRFLDDAGIAPPELIQGLSQPSADLMLEEMRLRMASLADLLEDAQIQRHKLAHTPSVWPTKDAKRRINSKFGMRRDPITNKWREHSGVDITADYGSSVFSTADGVVSFSGYHEYLGNLIKVDHGYGVETWYGHLSKRALKKGDVVKRGDVVGKVGSTGRSTGPHIHYEVHVNSKRVDPRTYMGR
jgi:murein DD-endopeptidase MepM/ murein hydrolase activator NlpD